MSKPRIIAFYLPQYYPTDFNDKWWEPGFTEWTNVAKAKPLFPGHYQPKLPGELGFYDLRLPQTRERQAELAKIAGVESFMYWHYWTDGKKVLNEVFEEVVKSGKPDMGFSLCWANHSWTKCAWNGYKKSTLLLEQKYPGRDDHVKHFYDLLPAFKDRRYTRVNGKLLFAIFSPYQFPNVNGFISLWNELAKKEGLNGFYFVALNKDQNRASEMINLGFDAVADDYMDGFRQQCYMYSGLPFRILRRFFGLVFGNNYKEYCDYVVRRFKVEKMKHPCIYPNWDHSARSGKLATMFRNAEPSVWRVFCKRIFKECSTRNPQENLVFVKSWNEWGEGNYLEPDRKYKRGYINKLREAIDSYE